VIFEGDSVPGSGSSVTGETIVSRLRRGWIKVSDHRVGDSRGRPERPEMPESGRTSRRAFARRSGRGPKSARRSCGFGATGDRDGALDRVEPGAGGVTQAALAHEGLVLTPAAEPYRSVRQGLRSRTPHRPRARQGEGQPGAASTRSSHRPLAGRRKPPSPPGLSREHFRRVGRRQGVGGEHDGLEAVEGGEGTGPCFLGGQDVSPETGPIEVPVRRQAGFAVPTEIERQTVKRVPRRCARGPSTRAWKPVACPRRAGGPSPPRSCRARRTPAGVAARVGRHSRAG